MTGGIYFGKTCMGTDTQEGEDVVVYELTGTNGMRASVMNYGANLLTLFVPDKNRDCKDIVLGYEHLEDYFTNDAFFVARRSMRQPHR